MAWQFAKCEGLQQDRPGCRTPHDVEMRKLRASAECNLGCGCASGVLRSVQGAHRCCRGRRPLQVRGLRARASPVQLWPLPDVPDLPVAVVALPEVRARQSPVAATLVLHRAGGAAGRCDALRDHRPDPPRRIAALEPDSLVKRSYGVASVDGAARADSTVGPPAGRTVGGVSCKLEHRHGPWSHEHHHHGPHRHARLPIRSHDTPEHEHAPEHRARARARTRARTRTRSPARPRP